MLRPTTLLAFTFALSAAPATASAFIPVAAIDSAVASFLGVPAGRPGGAVRQTDPRLKLADCDEGIEVSWFGRTGNTLQVQCRARGWRLFVAVNAGDNTTASMRSSGETIINKGETIDLMYEGEGFTLSRQGEALEPGAQNQWIRIRPVGENSKPVRGMVVRPGVARVSAE